MEIILAMSRFVEGIERESQCPSLSNVRLSMTPQTAAHQAPCPWDSLGKNSRIGCHFLLQGIFLIQGSSPVLLHCRKLLQHLSHQGSLQTGESWTKKLFRELLSQSSLASDKVHQQGSRKNKDNSFPSLTNTQEALKTPTTSHCDNRAIPSEGPMMTYA